MLKTIKELFNKNNVSETGKQVAEEAIAFDTAKRENLNLKNQIEKSKVNEAFNTLHHAISKSAEEHRQKMRDEMFPRKIEDFKSVALDQKTEISYAMDGIGSFLSDTQQAYILKNEIIDRMHEVFIGWSNCAVLSQNWLISRALTIPCEDAIASGFKFSIANTDDKTDEEENEKFLKELQKDAEDFMIAEVCKKANYLKKTFGYCLVIPVIENADMSKPFNIDGIRKGSYKGMAVIEPMWVTPQFDDASRNPMNKDFYEPSSYVIAGSGGKVIHKSWLIKLVNAPVPDILKPVYYFGGISLPQMIYERVYCAEAVANEAPMLAKTKRTMYISGDLENAIANPEIFAKRMTAFTELRDNFAVALIPEGEQIGQLETTLTDLDQTIMTQYQLVSSIAQMPVTKLLKVEVKGFNSSGQYEMDDYNQTLVAIQNNDFKPIIKYHNQLLVKSKYNKDVDINIIFNEIDSPSAEENARIRLADAQRDSVLIGSGVISADEVREKMRNDENSLYTVLADDDFIDDENADLTDEITDKNNEEIEKIEEVKQSKTSEILD
jgi:phage-related protein (TIGR01555 family)